MTRDGQASTAVLTVLGQGVESGDVLQEQSWSTPDGTTRSGTSWSPEAELLEWSDSDGSSSCTYDHPVQWLRLPLSPGAQWQGQSSCSYSDNSGMLVRTVQSSAARVVTAASTDLGGDRIFCWVVERDVVTTSVAGDTRATSETRTTDLFAPSLGLTVYETGKSAVPQADGSVATDTWTARLDS